MALLLLAHAALPGRVEAATVDHGLRPESAGEAGIVAELCQELGIRHGTLVVSVPRGNMQEQARLARYAALEGWARDRAISAIATAHHADDQAETVLMRLNRGSGVAGLAGIRACGTVPGGETTLLRPLLGWRRAELAGIIERAGVETADDPGNRDPAFDRARMREVLAGAGWLDVDAMARSAANLADAADALASWADDEWRRHVYAHPGKVTYNATAPHAVRYLVAMRAIAFLTGSEPRGGALAELMDRLENGGKGNIAGVMVGKAASTWFFEREPPRKTACRETGPDPAG